MLKINHNTKEFYHLIKLFPDEMYSLIHRFRCEVILYTREKSHIFSQKKIYNRLPNKDDNRNKNKQRSKRQQMFNPYLHPETEDSRRLSRMIPKPSYPRPNP